jgi:hypothetical protein
MVNLVHSKNSTSFQKKVDINRNILIIGRGASDYKLNEVVYYDQVSTVEELYGNSELSRAFKKAKDMDVKNVFVANVKIPSDYIGLIDIIKQYDFAFIVPISIKFSDVDVDLSNLYGRDMTYIEYFLEEIGDNTRSLLVVTDNHASMYENIDSFIMDMSKKIAQFKNSAMRSLRNGRSLCFVANNLKNSNYANLELACALSTCKYSDYPSYDFGEAVFDIDESDIDILESVENLKNFRTEFDASKIVVIDLAIKYIERQMDFSNFEGKFYSDYIKLEIYKKLSTLLQSMVGIVIRNYSIDSINFVNTEPGTGVIVNSFSVLPINSAEFLDLVMEV